MRHELLDGKYTIVFDEKTGRLEALRYGEPWRDLVGDGLVLAMLQEIDRLKAGQSQRVPSPGDNGADHPGRPGTARWAIEYEDERDFCNAVSPLTGAVFADARSALERFEQAALAGVKTHGRVSVRAIGDAQGNADRDLLQQAAQTLEEGITIHEDPQTDERGYGSRWDYDAADLFTRLRLSLKEKDLLVDESAPAPAGNRPEPPAGPPADEMSRATPGNAVTAKQPRDPFAWYVERVAPGRRDHGLKLGPFWKREQAEEWVDERHVLKPLFDGAEPDGDVNLSSMRASHDASYRMLEGRRALGLATTAASDEPAEVPGAQQRFFEVRVKAVQHSAPGKPKVEVGTWQGLAENETQAQRKAVDALWDARLDAASCNPICTAREESRYLVCDAWDHAFAPEGDAQAPQQRPASETLRWVVDRAQGVSGRGGQIVQAYREVRRDADDGVELIPLTREEVADLQRSLEDNDLLPAQGNGSRWDAYGVELCDELPRWRDPQDEPRAQSYRPGR